MKFLKIACLLFSMFLFSSNALAEETGISVSGPDILIDGACYSATGGSEPYHWTTSAGSIGDGGCVSNVPNAQCGIAAITASDDCRVTGSKAVELTEGCPSISGPDAPQNGSCYGADNAVGAVQWGITKGSIDSNGCVSNITDQCGAATITAMDASGNTSVRDIRMPGGKWVIVSASGCNPHRFCSSFVDGAFKTSYASIACSCWPFLDCWDDPNPQETWCSAGFGICPGGNPCGLSQPTDPPGASTIYKITWTEIQEWRCQ